MPRWQLTLLIVGVALPPLALAGWLAIDRAGVVAEAEVIAAALDSASEDHEREMAAVAEAVSEAERQASEAEDRAEQAEALAQELEHQLAETRSELNELRDAAMTGQQGVVNDQLAPSYVAPDEATLRGIAREVFNVGLGRTPTENELQAQVDILKTLDRQAWEAHSRGEQFDVAARYIEQFEADYASALEFRRDAEESRRSWAALEESLRVGACVMAGHNC